MRRTIEKHPELTFVVVYTREPHARQLGFKEIAQPIKWEERRDLARRTKKEMGLAALFLVDEMGDPSRKLFGDVPNPAIFIEPGGKIKAKLSWADASEVDRLIEKWQPVPLEKPKGEDDAEKQRKEGIFLAESHWQEGSGR